MGVQGAADGYGMSTPYQNGGQVPADAFGVKGSEGEKAAAEFKDSIIARKKRKLAERFDVLLSQDSNLDNKIWWIVRDNVRGNDLYTMRKDMNALAAEAADSKAAKKATATVFTELATFDVALRNKNLAESKKEYADLKAAVAAFQSLV